MTLFGCFEAMSAIEMIDPKMDAGMLCNRGNKKANSFDQSIEDGSLLLWGISNLDLIGIIDTTLACMLLWLEGHSLAMVFEEEDFQGIQYRYYLYPDAMTDSWKANNTVDDLDGMHHYEVKFCPEHPATYTGVEAFWSKLEVSSAWGASTRVCLEGGNSH
ncbi:N-alpha-acetyltransferase 35, NatC auxiliary subunit-like [Atheta coriaria]|uniref:N-alpha-acetyltransferase 35, NatC auxiliary subunit-like n=1 Tax=Dalotia coriaria TaxID=877792 RepID=UPI0031F43FBF